MSKIFSLGISTSVLLAVFISGLALLLITTPNTANAQTVSVTIHKYVDGVHADTTNAEGQSFPMTATWDSTSHGSGSGPFSLSSPSYDAQTVNFNSGADYSASEDFDEASVGASCADGKPFALVGYSSGDTELEAAGAAISPTPPQLVDMTTDKHIIVWNEDCTPTLTVTKIVINDNGGTATISDFTLFIDNATTTSGAATTTTPGAHVVSETNIAGYTATVGGDCDSSGNVTLAAGEHKECTITNDDIPPDVMVTIIKYVDGVHADATNAENQSFPMTATWSSTSHGSGSGPFSLDPSGSNGAPAYEAYTVEFNSGADYSASEDFDEASVGASCADGKPFALVGYTSGDDEATAAAATLSPTPPLLTNMTTDKHIIVWNEDCTPTLTVTKIVINDNGGTATTSDFALFIDGNPVVSGEENDVSVGAHVVSETASSTYTATIGGDCDSSGNVTLAAGEHKECTITNDDVAPDVTVTIIKYVDGVHADVTNAEGQSFPMSSCWNATNIGAGCGSFSLSPVGFNNPNPYEATTADMSSGADYSTNEETNTSSVGASCAEGKPFALVGYTTGDSEAAAAAAPISTTSPAFTGITTDKFVIVWNEDCTPSLTLDKIVVNDDGGTQPESAWTLTATGPTPISGPGAAGSTDVQSDQTFQPGTYDLSEVGPAGYSASAWSCVGGTQVDGDTVTIAAGEDVVCTIVNDDIPATIIVKKVLINDNGGTRATTTFSFRIDGGASQNFQFDAQNDVEVNPGTHSVVENAAAGYITTYSNSQNANADCNNLTVGAGQSVTCTITNDDVAPPPADACTTLIVPPGYTLVNGTPGNDVVTLAPFSMFVGMGGNDTVTSSQNGNYIVCTLGGRDVIRLSGAGAVTIDAGNGNNSVNLGNMTGFITTGTGDDQISAGNGARTINAGNGKNTVSTGSGNQTVTTGSGNDTITTNGGNDVVNAGNGANKVFSKGGNDNLTAGSGNDFFDAGAGIDTCNAGGGSNTVINCSP